MTLHRLSEEFLKTKNFPVIPGSVAPKAPSPIPIPAKVVETSREGKERDTKKSSTESQEEIPEDSAQEMLIEQLLEDLPHPHMSST